MSVRKWSVGAILVAVLAGLLMQIDPIEVCCLKLPARDVPVDEPSLLRIQREVEARSARPHSGFPSFDTLRILATGRDLGPRIYGPDDRRDLFAAQQSAEPVDPKIAANMTATALIVESGVLEESGGRWKLKAKRLLDYKVCGCERHADQISTMGASPCTGFLLRPDLVLTASHCIPESDYAGSYKFVFGFHVQPDGNVRDEFDGATAIRSAAYVAYRSPPCEPGDPDLLIAKLDKPVDFTPAARSTETAMENQKVYVIGYPLGLPAKYAPNAKIRPLVEGAPYFRANIDGYKGNSGSPVFNERHEVLGVHVRGVLSMAKPCGCWTSTWCPDTGCKGEDITKISELPDLNNLWDQEKPVGDPPPPNNVCGEAPQNPHPMSEFEKSVRAANTW